MADDRETIVAFLRSHATDLATRVEELPYGAGLFNPEISSVWDFNVVWVDALPPWLDAPRLIADAERLHVSAGVRHRQIIVPADSAGARFSRELQSSGYVGRRHVIMVLTRAPDRPSASAVEELGVDDVVRFTKRELRQTDFAQYATEIAQSKRIAASAGARFFGVRRRRTVVSACDLYLGDGIAQIESVVTAEAHRNHGYARALVLHAAGEAHRAGARLVFLVAEEDDWPKELYRKLGFDEVGAISLFLRTPRASPRGRG